MARFNRNDALAALASTHYDVMVIGAGMTGAGVALDAASRGLKVALVEAGDIASGTSSKSSKMVHGGLRYLQQKEFRLVYENLRERQRLLENAPYLVRPLPFLIPLFGKNPVVTKTLVKGYSTALRLYEITGGWRIGTRYRRISASEAVEHLPTLNTEHLAAGFIYMDARGDDARVALTLARTAALDFGADVANYVRVTGFVHGSDGRVNEVTCRNELDGSTFSVSTKTVVNATGVWADNIFSMAEQESSQHITPAKGVHLSVPSEKLPADLAAVLSVPGDRRSIFVVPFEEAPYTFIGTTDTPYQGELDDPDCTPLDVQYLLDAVNAWTTSNLSAADVTGVWAGLRPLLAPAEGSTLSERTADLSRRHQVTDSNDGVVHITGGKWTTYRQMAEDTVDALRPYFSGLRKTRTKNLRLHGVSAWRPEGEMESHLYRRFGGDTIELMSMISSNPALGERMIENQPYLGAEFVFSAKCEMTTSLVDLLTRRTRAHLHDARNTLKAAPDVAAIVAPILGWDEGEVSRQVQTYRDLVEKESTRAGLSF